MTVTRRREAPPAPGGPAGPDSGSRDRDPDDWVLALSLEGPDQHLALRRLHGLLVRASRHQVWRMRSMLGNPGSDQVDEVAQQAADEAMVSLLAKLHTFEGRSRFTTWACKFAILQAATEVRKQAWRSRQVVLEDVEVTVDLGASVEQYAEAADLARAATRAIREALTPYQRSIMVALLVDAVPIDVLADRLGTNRNALYKTLHDARVRVRARLTAEGHLGTVEGGGSR